MKIFVPLFLWHLTPQLVLRGFTGMKKTSIKFPLLIKHGCGLDVHKSVVVATVLNFGGLCESKSFGCFTQDLYALRDWLLSHQISHVAMESTSVYWKPIFNVLEPHFEVLLVNARHIKHVPGKKTDQKDSEWIAQLLISGLLENSFIPPQKTRELRDLSRYRRKVQRQLSAEKNRIHKQLQDANIKLSCVISDLFGQSGRRMLQAMAAGETSAEQLAAMASKRIKAEPQALTQALTGCIRPHHVFMLEMHLANIQYFSATLEKIDARMDELLADARQACDLLESIPGVCRPTLRSILAEIGTDMSVFPDQHQLASWAGMCPGNHVSAGKSYHSRARPGNRALKTTLMEAAWAAVATKNSWFRAKYLRMTQRMGKKKALFAIAHKLLTTAYMLLKEQQPYRPMEY